jgi:hypothetical protein
MVRLINNDSVVTQLWNPITLRSTEDGGDVLRNVGSNYTRYEVPATSIMKSVIQFLHPLSSTE